MLNKRALYLLFLSSLLLSGCDIDLSSLDNSTSTATSESTEYSETNETTTSNSTEISSSTSSSSSVISLQTLTISRATWTDLGAYPTTESIVVFDGFTFGYSYAGNYTTGVIQGKKDAFYLYNQSSLNRITEISLTLTAAKTTFTLLGGATENPTVDAIAPQTSDDLNFLFDFSAYQYPYFRLENGAGVIYIESIVITFEGTGSSSSSVSSSSSSSSSTSSSTISTSTSASTSTSSAPAGDGYYRSLGPTISQEQYKAAADLYSLPSTGTVNVLVIPVTFSDYRCTGSCASTRKSDIQKAFFGQAAETGWESLQSYYFKSSYGNLTINGTVTDWYDSSYSTSSFANLTGSGTYASYYDPTWTMLNNAVSWYKTQSGSTLTEYDTDSDGFLDAVYLIYNNPNATNAAYSANGENVYWAYTYWNYNNLSSSNLNSPVGMTYCWASYDFMYEGYGASAVDAHTYIHESGHVLGLDDYYTYTSGDWGAAGGVDMMDYNIVDHNAYSKYVLGWTNPYVIDGTQTTTTITIDPFESSGDFILVNNGWNGSPYDEYLAIELYTPTGLNESDSLAPYANGLQGFTIPGIKVYHVDSRLGKYSNSTGAFSSYTDTLNVGASYYPYVAMSNSSEYSNNPDWKLIHLLEESGVNTFKNNGAVADDNTLFTLGSTFNPTSTHSTFFNASGKFNDASSIGYTFTVTALSSGGATLTFTKI